MGAGDEDECLIKPSDVLLALRSELDDEDVRFLQWDIGRLLFKLSPDERCLLLLYSSGKGVEHSAQLLHIEGNQRAIFRKFERAVRRLTDLLNGDER